MANQSLIPKAGQWLDNNFNVMLVGLHGVGKTQVILDECENKGLKLKYYSCATLDPFTDLVGVPFARTDEDGTEHLKMVRPRDIDDAEIIFMDEFNRADSKVHNALMEIIQFRSLNGEPLPNLRMVWAAMNPPGGEYDVDELDPALLDRFDIFEDVAARPSIDYMVSKGIRKEVAQAIVQWWRDQDKDKRSIVESISPRRLEKIGHVYEATGDFKSAIPNWFSVDRGKLRNMLNDVEVRAKAKESSPGSSSGPRSEFQYSPDYLKNNATKVAEYLRENTADHETHKAVRSAIESRHGARMVRDFGEIVDAMIPAVREGMLADMTNSKRQRIAKELAEVDEWRKPALRNFQAAVDAA